MFVLGVSRISARPQDNPRSPAQPSLSCHPQAGWTRSTKRTELVRSSARARGTLMCTFKCKCWDHLFSDHRWEADNQDGGKEASSWDLLRIHPGPWLLSTKGQAKRVVQGPTGPVQCEWLWNDPASVELSSGRHFPFSCPVINSIAWLPGCWPWRAQLSMLLSPREHCEYKQNT